MKLENIENVKERIREDNEIHPKNKELILKFQREELKDYTEYIQSKYMEKLPIIAKKLGIPFNEAKKGDIEKFILWLEKRKDIDEKLDYRIVLKRFYKWIGDGKYPECMKFITTPKMNKEKVEEFNRLLKMAFETHGIKHLDAIERIRELRDQIPEEEIIRIIEGIDNKYYLRRLMEAGMREKAWHALQRQLKKVEGGIILDEKEKEKEKLEHKEKVAEKLKKGLADMPWSVEFWSDEEGFNLESKFNQVLIKPESIMEIILGGDEIKIFIKSGCLILSDDGGLSVTL